MRIPGAKPNVAKLREDEDLKGLTKALGYQKDPAVRRDAVLVLRDFLSAQTLSVYLAFALEPDHLVPSQQARKMRIDGFFAVAAPLVAGPLFDGLVGLLDDQDVEVRREAVRTIHVLGVGRKRAVGDVEILRLSHRELVEESIAGLPPGMLEALTDGREVEPLVGALGDRDAAVRAHAVEALAEVGDDRALTRLKTLAEHDPDPEVRGRADEAAAQIQNIAPPG
jgi:hypothetical protein